MARIDTDAAALAHTIDTEFRWNRHDERGDLFDRLVVQEGRAAATRQWLDACDLLDRVRREEADTTA